MKTPGAGSTPGNQIAIHSNFCADALGAQNARVPSPIPACNFIGQRELAALREIAQAAGREILDVYDTAFTSWQKADETPLTHADLRADVVIREALQRAFPGVFIWSEESCSPMEGNAPPAMFFLVDPLDGTREFLQRNGEFTVNIALVHQGEPVAGVVHAPALHEMFHAARGLGAFRERAGQSSLLRVAGRAERGELRVIGSRSHGGPALSAWLEQLAGPHTFLAAGSSLKFCRIAEGAADVYPRLGPTCQWDTAAGQAVLECAGGAVLDPSGRDLRYGLDRPVLNPFFVALARRDLPVPPIQARP